MASVDESQRQLDMANFKISSLGDPTAANDATKTDNSTAPANPAAAASAGTSFKAAPVDHVHQGVHSNHADANANIFGDIQFVSGSGIALSQAGNVITIAAAAGSVNKVTWAVDDQVSNIGTVETIVREWNVNFDDAGSVGNIQARLTGIVKAAAGIGTYKLYVGATAFGATAGGTARATITTSSVTFESQTNLGAAFANPGGAKIVQLTVTNDTAATKSTIRGFSVALG